MKEIKTWEGAEHAMADFYNVSADLNLILANEAREIAKARTLYAARLESLKAEAEGIERALIKFAKEHKKDFKPREDGGEARSVEHAGVAMGYRLDPPKVRIEEEDEAVDWLIRAGYGDEYVRTRVEPNREAIRDLLNNDADPLVEKFAAHGITKQQKDRFFLEIVEAK